MDVSNDLKTAIDAHIASLELDQRKPEHLYKPMHYILSLKGKRIRPVLLMLAYHAMSGDDPTKVLNLAAAMELFHNFTLMHDDIMDCAPVRRGKPTAHLVWNENTAILSGDALFAISMGLIVKDIPAKSDQIVESFSRISVEVCEGQMEDMDMEEREDVTIEEYIEMIRKKTAVLLGGSLSIGSMAGGASPEVIDKVGQFGENLGIAFQLQDDMMDAFPPEGFGKQVGGDILQHKKTYLWLKAFQLANPEQLKRLHTLMEEKDEAKKVEGILGIYNELDIPAITQQLILHYFEKARTFSQELLKVTSFQPVIEYLEKIINRKI